MKFLQPIYVVSGLMLSLTAFAEGPSALAERVYEAVEQECDGQGQEGAKPG